MNEIIKIFKAELIKITAFILSISLSLVYVMKETNRNITELLDYLLRNIAF